MNEKITKQTVRQLEEKYKKSAKQNVNSMTAIEAYAEWHKTATQYLSHMYDSNNEQFKTFMSIDNAGNGYELYNNFMALYTTYNFLMNPPTTQVQNNNQQLTTSSMAKPPMIFISHSSKDKVYVEALVDLLESIGFTSQNLFCSSVPEFGIRLSQNIFDELRELFYRKELYVIFIHSPRYYRSTVSQNEMGAAWVLKTRFYSFLTNDMKLSEMNGVINGQSLSIKVDASDAKARLNQWYEELQKIFHLTPLNVCTWERKRDRFLDTVTSLEYPDENENPNQIMPHEGSSIDEEYKRLQIQQMKEVADNAQKANIRANVVSGLHQNGMRELRIFNCGQAKALNVRIKCLTPTDGIYMNPQFTNIDDLSPQTCRTYYLHLTMGHQPTMKLSYQWEDEYSVTNSYEETIQI